MLNTLPCGRIYKENFTNYIGTQNISCLTVQSLSNNNLKSLTKIRIFNKKNLFKA